MTDHVTPSPTTLKRAVAASAIGNATASASAPARPVPYTLGIAMP